jgi:hypothetical protein
LLPRRVARHANDPLRRDIVIAAGSLTSKLVLPQVFLGYSSYIIAGGKLELER